MSTGVINRPFKWGQNDKREFIVQNSEVSLVAINDTNGNPVFIGRAKVGTNLGVAKWQIRKVTWDSTQSPTRMQWPQNASGNASSDYEFTWSSDTDLTITTITQANPAVVTVVAIGDLVDGDMIVIQGVTGMTEVNFDGSNIYTVANSVGNTFELQGIDSTAYGAYIAGGTVIFGSVVNLTYS
jgi:hypothetical protein